jgi:hypothetical protein
VNWGKVPELVSSKARRGMSAMDVVAVHTNEELQQKIQDLENRAGSRKMAINSIAKSNTQKRS